MHRLAFAVLIASAAACGKQGPPLPPLRLAPGAVADLAARRSGDDVRFSFVLPAKNTNGTGTVNLGRVEVFAATVAPGAVPPTSQELMSPRHLVATVEVRPPAATEKTPPATAPKPDTRPAPGDRVTVTEKLDAAKLQPAYTTPVAPPVTPSAPPAAPAAATPPPVASRLYVIRPVGRNGRPGPPTARIELPLVEPPPPPSGLSAKFTASAVTLAWTPPPMDPPAPLGFNIYSADGTTPLNANPLMETTFDRPGIDFGKEECFVVRSVTAAGAVPLESAASPPACLTPADVFPPSEPKGLAAVAAPGLISLIWDANPEPDMAGYLVLRGEVPGDKLQALTPTPIKETTFRDTTVKPGVRYAYVIVAVDQAKNASGQSMRVEETAR